MGLLLAAASALVYGTADFLGGFAARRVQALLVALTSQIMGLMALSAVVAVWPHGNASGSDWMWGAIGGVGGGLGLAGFYRALALGPMSVIAPVTAVTSALVPLVVGLAQGDRPSWQSWLGLIAAVPAIALVSTATDEPGGARVAGSTLATALAAGVAFGLFFVAFAQTSPDAELWPLVAARLASITLLGSLTLATRSTRESGSWGDARAAIAVIAGAGILDTGANGLYLLSTHTELLSESAVLAAMYPVSTVVLARVVLQERFLRPQLAGMALALVAVGLIAGGR